MKELNLWRVNGAPSKRKQRVEERFQMIRTWCRGKSKPILKNILMLTFGVNSSYKPSPGIRTNPYLFLPCKKFIHA